MAPALTDAHMLVLGLLRDGTVATADDLAERLGLDVGRVVALLDDLVRGGFIRPAVTHRRAREKWVISGRPRANRALQDATAAVEP